MPSLVRMNHSPLWQEWSARALSSIAITISRLGDGETEQLIISPVQRSFIRERYSLPSSVANSVTSVAHTLSGSFTLNFLLSLLGTVLPASPLYYEYLCLLAAAGYRLSSRIIRLTFLWFTAMPFRMELCCNPSVSVSSFMAGKYPFYPCLQIFIFICYMICLPV